MAVRSGDDRQVCHAIIGIYFPPIPWPMTLVATDLTKGGSASWAVTMGLLHTPRVSSKLSCSLSCKLMVWPYIPEFKKHLMYNDVTTKYRIYLLLPISFFVRIMGCDVNCCKKIQYIKTRIHTLNRLVTRSFSENNRIAFKFNSSLFLLSD